MGTQLPPKKGAKTLPLAETAKWWQIGPHIVGQTVQVGPHIILKLNRKPVLVLCGFRHISTYGLGVGASLASFITVFGRPLQVSVCPMLRERCLVCNVGVQLIQFNGLGCHLVRR